MLMQIMTRGLVVLLFVRLYRISQEQRAGLIKYQSQVLWENAVVSFMKLTFLTLSVWFVASRWEKPKQTPEIQKFTKSAIWNSVLCYFQVVLKVGKKTQKTVSIRVAPMLLFIKNKLRLLIIDSFPEDSMHFIIQDKHLGLEDSAGRPPVKWSG